MYAGLIQSGIAQQGSAIAGNLYGIASLRQQLCA
jgi:hypothetical protein